MDIAKINNLIENHELKVAVFGTGRIGLPTALMYAKAGYKTIGVDINENLIRDLRNKKTFIDEPGLPEILSEVIDRNLIEFTIDFEYAIKNSNVMIICVPTPVNQNKIPIFTAIEDVAKKIGILLRKDQIVINESSVSPTTIETLIIPIIEQNSNLKINDDFGVCSCPERADPGNIVDNWDKVARIVGGSSDDVGKMIVKLYHNISKAEIVQVSTPGTANAVKLTENIFRDVNIALMNEFAVLYEKLGIDVKEVIRGSSTKYNFQPHYPGPGVGGPCLPANSYYIIKDAINVDYIPFMIRVAREINDRMPAVVMELIQNALNFTHKSLKGSIITVLGLSYKANIKDVQISPALKVIQLLNEKQANIQIWDPYYKGENVLGYPVGNSLEESLQNTDCIVVLTDHKEFYDIDLKKIQKNMQKTVVLVDSRNIYEISNLPQNIVYCGVGRKIRKI